MHADIDLPQVKMTAWLVQHMFDRFWERKSYDVSTTLQILCQYQCPACVWLGVDFPEPLTRQTAPVGLTCLTPASCTYMAGHIHAPAAPTRDSAEDELLMYSHAGSLPKRPPLQDASGLTDGNMKLTAYTNDE